jgi:hypothetical protein
MKTKHCKGSLNRYPSVKAEIRRDGRDDFWLNLGLVFDHKDGKGFNIMLQALSLDGKIVCSEITAEDEAARRNRTNNTGRHIGPLQIPPPAGAGSSRSSALDLNCAGAGPNKFQRPAHTWLQTHPASQITPASSKVVVEITGKPSLALDA